jgi:hypothetical protein
MSKESLGFDKFFTATRRCSQGLIILLASELLPTPLIYHEMCMVHTGDGTLEREPREVTES